MLYTATNGRTFEVMPAAFPIAADVIRLAALRNLEAERHSLSADAVRDAFEDYLSAGEFSEDMGTHVLWSLSCLGFSF